MDKPPPVHAKPLPSLTRTPEWAKHFPLRGVSTGESGKKHWGDGGSHQSYRNKPGVHRLWWEYWVINGWRPVQSLEMLWSLGWEIISEEMLGLLFIRACLLPVSTQRFLPMMNPLAHAFLTEVSYFSPPFFPPQFFSFLKVHCCLVFAGPDIRELVSFAEYPTWSPVCLCLRISLCIRLGSHSFSKVTQRDFPPAPPNPRISTAALDFSWVFSFCYWLVFKLCDLWP